MKKEEEPPRMPPEIWSAIVQHSHAATVIWGAAYLDYRVGWLLAAYMPHLSNTLKAKLFEYPGALSAFSARIDVARALGLIEQSMSTTLHKARELRNEFAHSPIRLKLTDEEPLKLLKQLDPQYKLSMDPLNRYLDKVTELGAELEPKEQTMALVKALRDYVPKPHEPPAKSGESSPPRPHRSRGRSGKDAAKPPRSSRG